MTKSLVAMTLGTSTHDWPTFQRLLERSGAGAVVDVRAYPYSRLEHFNRPVLQARLTHLGFPYVGLPELGGAASDDARSYSEIAATEAFSTTVDMVVHIARRCVPILICAEGSAIECHRFLQISPALIARGVEVLHVATDGSVQTHHQLEAALLKKLRLREDDLWEPRAEIVKRAFRIQEKKIRGNK